MSESKIAIIGCGRMGGGLARILAKQNKVTLCDHNPEKGKQLAAEIGAQFCETAKKAVEKAGIVLLAIKPQDLAQAVNGLKLDHDHTVVSILAGVTRKKLMQHFPDTTVLRMMPNLACTIGQGVVALADHSSFSAEQRKEWQEVFACLGSIHWLPEDKIDAATALTGSAPAYAFVLIESMVDAGIAMGFSPEQAKALVLEMWHGSISLLKESNQHPAELKWLVTSPAGTTIAGLCQLEQEGVRAGIINTLLACYTRSQKMADQS